MSDKTRKKICKPYADRWVEKADELWNAGRDCPGCKECGNK